MNNEKYGWKLAFIGLSFDIWVQCGYGDDTHDTWQLQYWMKIYVIFVNKILQRNECVCVYERCRTNIND